MKYAPPTPPHIRIDLSPTDRELRWFAQMDRHGPQSSEFLYECTRDTHRCRDTALRRMQALREAGYLRLPPQQRQIAKADFNPYVYDLTKLGWDILADHHELEKHCRPTGHWWHGFWVSAISSAIEITATRAGLTYVPAARILALRGVDMAMPVSGSKVIPDQLFALKYPDGYRAFALEVDRGAEPVRSEAARKSLARSTAQYREVLQEKLHQQHYGLKSNLMVLWAFTNCRRQAHFAGLLTSRDRRLVHTAVDALFPRWASTAQTVAESWESTMGKPFRLLG
ncbi:replication-relaxation family protein [Loktanella sp. Alg231-35]|uniref:replication-relaxation family protein n=1 Tax=Loktanella sp. Alg231-35 TaxID=1922220 RepID=UPI000D552DFA|nr:replication-relaxation family protein [Loktanella sp. Alg231-35]